MPGVLPWQLVLFANDLTPDHETEFADLVEPTWAGYHRVLMDRATWSDPTVLNGCARMQWGTVETVWDVTGPTSERVYGWGMLDELPGVLRFVQRFEEADIFPLAIGDKFRLQPVYTFTSAPCVGVGFGRRGRPRKPVE